jgi:hypothetical protein
LPPKIRHGAMSSRFRRDLFVQSSLSGESIGSAGSTSREEFTGTTDGASVGGVDNGGAVAVVSGFGPCIAEEAPT